MTVYEKPDPYDQWERFTFPWYKKLLMFLFLSKKERIYISGKVQKINLQRKNDHHKMVEAQREYGIRKMREYRNRRSK